MKKHITLSSLLLFSLLLTSNGCIPGFQQPNSIIHLVDSNGTINADLLTLLDQTNIQHDGSLEDIVAATQKEQPNGWLRPANKERWQLDELFSDKREELLAQFKKMNLFETISPQNKNYDYALLLGATVGAIRDRLAFLLDLWHQGIRFKYIVFLGGKRPLSSELENEQALLAPINSPLPLKENWQPTQMPTTELEMMKFVYDQTKLPEEFAQIPVVFVDAPMKQKSDGSWTRPATHDTINSWLALDPKPGAVLAISNQPHTVYQDAILHRFLPETFRIETVGSKAAEDIKTAILLHTLAGTLYMQLGKLQDQKN